MWPRGAACPGPSRAPGFRRLSPAWGRPGRVIGCWRCRSPLRKRSSGTGSGTARSDSRAGRAPSGAGSSGTCKKKRHQYATRSLSGEGALFAWHERLPPGCAARFPAGAVSSTCYARACGERPLLSITRLELTLCPVSSSGLCSTKETRSYCGRPQG